MIQDILDFTKLNGIVGLLHDLAIAILAAVKMKAMSFPACLPVVPKELAVGLYVGLPA